MWYVGTLVADLCFNEAHWILAFFYFKMAKNMPRVINEEQIKSYKLLYWLGVAFNAVMPIFFATFTFIDLENH